QVRIDGFSNVLSASQIQRIEIVTGPGNDTVELRISPELAAKVLADGGAGYDRILTPASPRYAAGFESWYHIPPPSTTSSGRAHIIYDENGRKSFSSGIYSATAYVKGKATQIQLSSVGNGFYLRSDAAAAFLKMRDAARNDGINLTITSAFRTYAQ